ncbi:MAG: GNAT family N-acetyltransferase [Pyrinomonadaceae bacterium]
MKTVWTEGAITIRPYRADDVNELYEAIRESIAEIGAWMEWAHPNYSLEESAAWVNSREEAWTKQSEYSFVITDTESGAFFGAVGLNQFNRTHPIANLGYWVRTSATGRGAASTAARLIARFGFEELHLERIEIVAAVGNHASQRVAEKTGAQREGVLRKRLMLYGKPHDAGMFSLVAEDLT